MVGWQPKLAQPVERHKPLIGFDVQVKLPTMQIPITISENTAKQLRNELNAALSKIEKATRASR